MSAATPGLRPLARAMGAGRRSPMAAAGLLLLGAFAMLSILHPWLMPYDPVAADASAVLQAPSAVHWFGTDANGMDVFSRVIYGAIYAFGIAFPAVAVAIVVLPVMGAVFFILRGVSRGPGLFRYILVLAVLAVLMLLVSARTLTP